MMNEFNLSNSQAADDQAFYENLIKRVERKSKRSKSRKKRKKLKKKLAALKEQMQTLEREKIRWEYEAKFSQFTAYISGRLGLSTDAAIEPSHLPRLGSGMIEEQRYDDRMQ